MTESEEEAGAVTRVRAGDTEAYAFLYRRYVSPVYSLALRMTGSVELAEDLTQEAFILAWRKIAQFRGDSAFFTWLYTLSVRLILRKTSRLKRERPVGIPVESLSAEHIPVDAGYDRTAVWALRDAITRLPARTRIAVVLFDIEGYSHAEISALMHIREGTSKALLHRGRTQLKRELHE